MAWGEAGASTEVPRRADPGVLGSPRRARSSGSTQPDRAAAAARVHPDPEGGKRADGRPSGWRPAGGSRAPERCRVGWPRPVWRVTARQPLLPACGKNLPSDGHWRQALVIGGPCLPHRSAYAAIPGRSQCQRAWPPISLVRQPVERHSGTAQDKDFVSGSPRATPRQETVTLRRDLAGRPPTCRFEAQSMDESRSQIAYSGAADRATRKPRSLQRYDGRTPFRQAERHPSAKSQ